MHELRTTHAYVILEVSPAAYEEIRKQLKDAGYSQAFHFQDGVEQIDMAGLALQRGKES